MRRARPRLREPAGVWEELRRARAPSSGARALPAFCRRAGGGRLSPDGCGHGADGGSWPPRLRRPDADQVEGEAAGAHPPAMKPPAGTGRASVHPRSPDPGAPCSLVPPGVVTWA